MTELTNVVCGPLNRKIDNTFEVDDRFLGIIIKANNRFRNSL